METECIRFKVRMDKEKIVTKGKLPRDLLIEYVIKEVAGFFKREGRKEKSLRQVKGQNSKAKSDVELIKNQSCVEFIPVFLDFRFRGNDQFVVLFKFHPTKHRPRIYFIKEFSERQSGPTFFLLFVYFF